MGWWTMPLFSLILVALSGAAWVQKHHRVHQLITVTRKTSAHGAHRQMQGSPAPHNTPPHTLNTMALAPPMLVAALLPLRTLGALLSHSRTSTTTSQTQRRRGKPEAAASQEDLVAALHSAGLLTDRAAAALRAVDRRRFVQTYTGVPDTVAYQDTALPISCGQTMPAFSVHAKFLSLLEPFVQPGSSVLDLGAGTGYMAACLAQLTGPGGSVLALEKQPKLVERAQASIQASSPDLQAAVDVRVYNVMAEPGPELLQGSDRFDAIHVGASLEEIPRAFVQLLRPGGRLVLPLGAMHGAAPQVIVTLDKGTDGTISKQQHGSLTTRIQPLTKAQDDDIWSK